MKSGFPKRIPILLAICLIALPYELYADTRIQGNMKIIGTVIGGIVLFGGVLLAALALRYKAANLLRRSHEGEVSKQELYRFFTKLDSDQIERLLRFRKHRKDAGDGKKPFNGAAAALLFILSLLSVPAMAQDSTAVAAQSGGLFSEPGIIITIVLLLIPVLGALLIMIARLNRISSQYRDKRRMEQAEELANYIKNMPDEEADRVLNERKTALDYKLSNQELAGTLAPQDSKGLIQDSQPTGLPFVTTKKRADIRPQVDPQLSRIVLWYIACATFWLLFGTSVGEYVGIKFVAPDADHLSWLSFGRLRPVHTNAVFWGWASLAMIGLATYVVPIVSNVRLASYKMAWWTLGLINAAVVLGSISLMAGINNGGGEYREYIWPIMSLFGAGLFLTLVNFLKTIARRTTKEIYVSNWYIVSAIIFTIVIALVAYLPFWQNGLGETIVQGYYMHQGVGMWFMLLTLGLVYYYLPQQLNKPIYSYSLGILAFWAQILFYTLIGSHHFVFSSIPWWLQTVAIVGSGGMAIPVIAGTTNFLMTFKGGWYKLGTSYTLPFFLVGTIFYFTGSLQGTAEAFRTTNLYWHFTDFTVAHSHLTMYGIITFYMWACIYAIVPRLTGKEPSQMLVGMHFWLALIGLMFYTVPLMYGATIRGTMWMEGKPFIETVNYMAQHWLWRAIGGSLMWISHLVFAYNVYKMFTPRPDINIRELAVVTLQQEADQTSSPSAQ